MKKLQILAAALLLHLGCFAQQALFGGQMPLSPEIHADKTVTFRCMAPEAHKVQITGDFLPTKKIDTPMGKYDMPGVADLKRMRRVCGLLQPLLLWHQSFIAIQ